MSQEETVFAVLAIGTLGAIGLSLIRIEGYLQSLTVLVRKILEREK